MPDSSVHWCSKFISSAGFCTLYKVLFPESARPVHGCLTSFNSTPLSICIMMVSFDYVITCYRTCGIGCTVLIEQGIGPLVYHPSTACGLLPISNEHQPNLHSQVFHNCLWSSGEALLYNQGSEVQGTNDQILQKYLSSLRQSRNTLS